MRSNQSFQAARPLHRVPVEWHDCLWQPPIQTSQRDDTTRRLVTKPLIKGLFLTHPACRKTIFKLMKNHSNTTRRFRAGFTLVELLVVIAIIAILAAMLMPVLIGVQKKAKVMKAKTEEAAIVTAIAAYEADYGKFPITKDEQTFAGANVENGHNDYTAGLASPGNGTTYNGSGQSHTSNQNIVAILMDMEKYGNGNVTSNNAHVYNPKQVKYLNAKPSGYDPATADPQPPGGVDITGIYRDPWGNPYIITVDADFDDSCSDLLYSLKDVSQNSGASGFNGLSNPNANPNTDNFLYHGKAMVWSAGPDKAYSSAEKANQGVNKDNVLSWQ